MGYYCTVPQCTSLAGKTKNVKFHRFPRDPTMAVKWNNILKRGKPFTKYSKVCSLHFTPTDYNITTMGQWKTLSKDAIPSQNLPKLNPDGTVMVIRKSRTVKYKECKKEEISVKTEKFTSLTQTQPLLEDVKQEQPDSSIAFRLQSNLPLHNSVSPVPKPRKQDAFMQTDPVLSEDEQNGPEVDYTFDMKKYDTPQDFSKQNEDYIPQTNEEYNKEAEKYALQRKNHNTYDKMDYQKSVIEESYTKIPDVYNGFREKEYTDFVYQNSYQDSVEILRNQQHNLQVLQEQHRINENQNFFNENHIKQEIEFPNEEEKFLYERNKEQIDQNTLYEHREQQRLLDHIAQVKQEPEVATGCDSVIPPQSSPYYSTEGQNHVTAPYYAPPRPGPELLIAKQNALAAHTQLWQNQMKRPFFYSDSTHYNPTPILHRCEKMNYSLEESPLAKTDLTKGKMARWVEAQSKGGEEVDVYGKPTEKQIQELDNIRKLSKELQDNLEELENTVRIPEVENQAMNPTAPILDYSEDHEFVSANKLDDYYSQEDRNDEKEAEKHRLTKGKAERTDVQRFYKDQCIFLTGGTGFLGKVLIEKLLRACGDLDTIYVLVRPKRGKDPITRIQDMLDSFLFERAHEVNPKCIHKVVPVVGDMQLPGLGLSAEDRKMLTSRVSIIINAAATVKFDEKLSVATGINVRGTKEILQLAKECRLLKALTHVSTAFSNTHVQCIEERFYEPPMSVEALEAVSQLDDNVIESILPALLGSRPNTYCLTKAVSEEAVRQYGGGLPACVIRPSIVVSTYEEPVRGWTDSMYGPTGLVVGIGTGVLRTMYMDLNKVADMVPVDLCVNAIIVSAFHTANNYKENQTSDIPIYNFVSGPQCPVTWGKFIEYNRKYGFHNPTMKAVWYYGLNATNNYYMFLFYNFFLHYLPALLIDVLCTLIGRRRNMLKFYGKVIKLANILFYFSTQDWKFSDAGVRGMWGALGEEDRVVFPFNLGDMSWDYMSETFLLGLRVYLVKDDLSTLPEARKKWNRLFYLHQLLKITTFSLLIYLGYILLKFFLGLF